MSRDVMVSTEYRNFSVYAIVVFLFLAASIAGFYLYSQGFTESDTDQTTNDPQPTGEQQSNQTPEKSSLPETIQLQATPTPYPTLTPDENQQLIQGLEELQPPSEVLDEIKQQLGE